MRPLIVCLIAALAMAAGCAPSIKQQAPDKLYYVLEASRPADVPSSAAPLAGVLAVRKLAVAPAFESRELLYQTAQSRLQPDYYNQFIVPPEDMATQAVRQWLADTGLFSSVGLPGSGMRQEFAMEGGITALYGDFTGAQAHAVLKAQFFLFMTRGTYDMVFHKDYSESVLLEDRSAAGLVAGMNTALVKMLSALEADLRESLSR